MEPEGTVRNLSPYGWCYYQSLVQVECGDKKGFFMGGHYDRGDPSPDSDIWIECFCSDCIHDPSPGLPGRRILCRHFEGHGGRSAAKKYLESIKTIGKDEKRQSLLKWIEGKCSEIGKSIVGHKVRVWWPAAEQGSGCYYFGKVTAFDAMRKDHHICYHDGSEEDLWLAVESWEDLGPIPNWEPPCKPSQSEHKHDQPLRPLRLSPKLHVQTSQHKASQDLQLFPPNPTSEAATEAGQIAEQLPKKRSDKPRGSPGQSASPKQQRRKLSRSTASSQARDISPQGVPETSRHTRMGEESSPMQVDPAGETAKLVHQQSQQEQEHVVSGVARSTAIPPAERSVTEWEAIFSATHIAAFSSEQMQQSIKELLRVMNKRSFAGTFVGKCSNLHEQPDKLARSLKALFQGCSQLFEFVDERQDMGQMKEMFHDFFATSEFTS